jgi:hypothetical protein
VALAAILAADPAAALAHDFFLVPSVPVAAPGAQVSVAMHVSDVFPGAPTPWRVGRTPEFFIVDRDGRRDLGRTPIAGDPAVARVALRAPGTSVVALVTDATYIEIEPAHFEEYLRHEGHEDIVTRRAGSGDAARPGRERYTRYVKTLIRARPPAASPAERAPEGRAPADRASSRPASPPSPVLASVGLKIEIVPETDPAGARPGGALGARVLFDGRPYAGGYLCATHAGYSREHDAYAWCGRLDGEGRTRVPIRAAGWQILRITRMLPRRDDPKADWESFWAALTFHVPEEDR